jgi:hypothetical protein
MHELIVASFCRALSGAPPGQPWSTQPPHTRYLELTRAEPVTVCPPWLSDAVRQHWQWDLAGRLLGSIATIRHPSQYGFVRATYELNLGCNYDFFWTNAGPLVSALVCASDGWLIGVCGGTVRIPRILCAGDHLA